MKKRFVNILTDIGAWIVVIAIIGGIIVLIVWAYFTFINQIYNGISQACIDQRFDACMATEKYSRQECIQIVGGK